MKNKFGRPPSSTETSHFYDDLMKGEESRGILGKDARYNNFMLMQKPSIQKYYVQIVKDKIRPTDHVLDLGCGPGTFMCLTAPFCQKITGVDISEEFVTATKTAIEQLGLKNADALVTQERLPFVDNSFDVVILVDVIHHLSNIDQVVSEASRVLKPGGRFILYEPNKLNPLIWLVHALDKNEWGLLRLGTPSRYREALSHLMLIERIDFNGIVIGPQSKIFECVSDFINHRFIRPILGWLNPKMVIFGANRK